MSVEPIFDDGPVDVGAVSARGRGVSDTDLQIEKPEALEPGLTRADKAVLAAVPEGGPDEWAKRELDMAATIWQVAETLDTRDLVDLDRTLKGLQHFGYVCSADSRGRKRRVYWRMRKGDELVRDQLPHGETV